MVKVFPIIPPAAKAFWVLGGIILVLVLMLGVFSYIAYASQQAQVILSADGLQIKESLYSRTIPATTLLVDQARPVDLTQPGPYQLKRRTNGIGLPGYQAGWFRLHNREQALVVVTDLQHVVYIPTQADYVVMLSVAQPQTFVQVLQQTVGGK